MDDPGSLIQIGFSAGARHAPNFDWVRNITHHDLPKQVITDLNYHSSSAFVLFWNLAKDTLPKDIINDFNTFLKVKRRQHIVDEPSRWSCKGVHQQQTSPCDRQLHDSNQ